VSQQLAIWLEGSQARPRDDRPKGQDRHGVRQLAGGALRSHRHHRRSELVGREGEDDEIRDVAEEDPHGSAWLEAEGAELLHPPLGAVNEAPEAQVGVFLNHGVGSAMVTGRVFQPVEKHRTNPPDQGKANGDEGRG
jgi:hypothetical protein